MSRPNERMELVLFCFSASCFIISSSFSDRLLRDTSSIGDSCIVCRTRSFFSGDFPFNLSNCCHRWRLETTLMKEHCLQCNNFGAQ